MPDPRRTLEAAIKYVNLFKLLNYGLIKVKIWTDGSSIIQIPIAPQVVHREGHQGSGCLSGADTVLIHRRCRVLQDGKQFCNIASQMH